MRAGGSISGTSSRCVAGRPGGGLFPSRTNARLDLAQTGSAVQTATSCADVSPPMAENAVPIATPRNRSKISAFVGAAPPVGNPGVGPVRPRAPWSGTKSEHRQAFASNAGGGWSGPARRCVADAASGALRAGHRERAQGSASPVVASLSVAARAVAPVSRVNASSTWLTDAVSANRNTWSCWDVKTNDAPFAAASAVRAAILPSTTTIAQDGYAASSVSGATQRSRAMRSMRRSSQPTSPMLRWACFDPVVQRPSTPAFHAGDRGFESLQGRIPP